MSISMLDIVTAVYVNVMLMSDSLTNCGTIVLIGIRSDILMSAGNPATMSLSCNAKYVLSSVD